MKFESGENRMEVNQKELAEALGISTRRIRELSKEYGLFERGLVGEKGRKRYILHICNQEYINYKIEAEVGGGTNLIKEKEQAEHEQIKKKISMLKLRRMRRELHEAEDVENFLTDMLIKFKNRLVSIPAKVAPLVQGEDDVNQIVSILEKEIYETLDELSEYDPMKIDGERIVINYDDEDEEEDEEDED